MGYAAYTLADGREAGYDILATCDHPECNTEVWRGFDALCGEWPNTHSYPKGRPEYGCQDYFCSFHSNAHDCPRKPCDTYPSETETAEGTCELIANHTGPHKDTNGIEFTLTEDDD